MNCCNIMRGIASFRERFNLYYKLYPKILKYSLSSKSQVVQNTVKIFDNKDIEKYDKNIF